MNDEIQNLIAVVQKMNDEIQNLVEVTIVVILIVVVAGLTWTIFCLEILMNRMTTMTTILELSFTRVEKDMIEGFVSFGKHFDRIEAQFDAVHARFNDIDARFDNIDARFDGVVHRIDGVNARLQHVDNGLHALQYEVHFIAQHVLNRRN